MLRFRQQRISEGTARRRSDFSQHKPKAVRQGLSVFRVTDRMKWEYCADDQERGAGRNEDESAHTQINQDFKAAASRSCGGWFLLKPRLVSA